MQIPGTSKPFLRQIRDARKFRLTMPPREQWPIFGIGILAALIAIGVTFWTTLPDVTQITKYAPSGAIEIYDGQNQLVTTIEGDEEREFVPLSSIPLVMQQAMMSAEDHNFYHHHGIDPNGIARAFFIDLTHARVLEGGSTITQQLAKVRFFDIGDRSIVRKLREAALATQLEKHYSKKQILEMYLNDVYFGRNAYGIEMAAERYFGIPAKKLNLPQSAFIAGVVRQPSYLGSAKHLDEVLDRQHEVIDGMVELHFISPTQAATAKATKLKFEQQIKPFRRYPYYVTTVMDYLRTQLPQNVVDAGGLRVYTNLDQNAQTAAERILGSAAGSVPPRMNDAALASIRVKDGAVVALVGGMGDYWKSQWNSAAHPHTMGSSFKPFVYLTGFMKGLFTPDSILDDDPIAIPQKGAPTFVPRNFDNKFMGPIPVRAALAFSRNVCAVEAAAKEGMGSVIKTAHDAGLTSKLEPYIPVALGADAASPIDMADAYSTFARGGVHIPPSFVRNIDGRGGTIKKYKAEAKRVFDKGPIEMLVSCMESVVKQGTGVMAQLPDRPVAGKTGTTDQGRDLWFVGFTPDLATAVWGGNKQHMPLAGNVTGGMVMAGLWKKYNVEYYKTHHLTNKQEQEGLADKDLWKVPVPALTVSEKQARSLGVDDTNSGSQQQSLPSSTSDNFTDNSPQQNGIRNYDDYRSEQRDSMFAPTRRPQRSYAHDSDSTAAPSSYSPDSGVQQHQSQQPSTPAQQPSAPPQQSGSDSDQDESQ